MHDRLPALALATLLLTGILAGCASSTAPGPSGAPAPSPEPATRFVALGDAGTGEADQAKVAAALHTVCLRLGCDFAVELGDNIYDAGASSANDPQFESKFEVPYHNFTMPFWMVLGNHDNSQDPAGTSASAGQGTWYQSGDNEVAYAKRTDRTSDKWRMPDRFYAFNTSLVDFLALDTNTLVFYDYAVPPELAVPVQKQTQWIDGAAKAATHAWKFALGHHGYRSNGPHGNAGDYDGRAPAPGLSGDYAKTFFETHVCKAVDVYLAGHDHDLEWLPGDATCPMAQLISGGGGASPYDLAGTNANLFQKSTLGFWWLEATAHKLTAVAYDDSGAALFNVTLAK